MFSSGTEPQTRLSLEMRGSGLKRESDGWYEFFDLATAEAGRSPEELMSDEEVVKKLPILFRTLRGQKVDDADLKELIRKIRGA